MDGWNTSFLLGWSIFRCYVSFREGNENKNIWWIMFTFFFIQYTILFTRWNFLDYPQMDKGNTLKSSTAQASQIATPNPHMHLPPPAPRARDRSLLPLPNSRYHHHLQIVVWSRSPWAKAPNEATLVEWDSMKLCCQRAAPRSVPSPSGRVPDKICFQTCGS